MTRRRKNDHGAFDEWINEAREARLQAYLDRKGLWKAAMHGDAGVPCPGCGGTDRFAVNTRKNVFLCRAAGASGDAIAASQHIFGFEFLAAVEDVTGCPAPGRTAGESAQDRHWREELARSRAAETEQKRCESEAEQNYWRERHRREAYGIWRAGAPIAGTPAEAYLASRGLTAPVGARLRYASRASLWNAPNGQKLHEGPALLAAIEGPDGRFAAVHRTWIDLRHPKGKAHVIDPKSGELLPAKKVLGPKKGGSILLWRPPGAARRLIIGEGIETVLAAHNGLAAARSPLFDGAEFHSAVDLGNLAGKAKGRVAHPTEMIVDKAGRSRRVMVPDAIPDPNDSSPLIPIPPSVAELILLGDGDSEAFFTRQALERAAHRFSLSNPRLTIRLAMAPDGRDFADLWKEVPVC